MVPDLAEGLPQQAFLSAPFRRVGVPERLLDSALLFRPARGVRALERPQGVAERAAGIVPVLSGDSAFSHVTAGALHGLPLSYAMERDDRLHVTGPLDTRRMRRPGIVAHRAFHPREVVDVDALRVVGLADTWVDFGELVGRGKPAGLDDLVVIGDAVATRLGSVRPLRAALMRRVRPRGKATLLEALEEVRVGSASPRETLARLMLVRCGLPEPALDSPVRDPAGRLLGIADLLWEEEAVAGEYQGEEFHGGEEERARDATRRRRFESRGNVTVEEIWKADIADTQAREDCVLRFAEALKVPRSRLDLNKAGPRFFSTHAMDLAIQRDMQRGASRSA